MKYTFYYKNYEHSKLATFVSRMQGSGLGPLAFAALPVLPFFIIGVNNDLKGLLIFCGIAYIGLTVFLFKISPDKIARNAFLKKHSVPLQRSIQTFVEQMAQEFEISVSSYEMDKFLQQVFEDLKLNYKKDVDKIIGGKILAFFESKGFNIE